MKRKYGSDEGALDNQMKNCIEYILNKYKANYKAVDISV